MKIGAYNPYLWTRGGGERYFLEAASLLTNRHEVEIVVPRGPGLVDELVDDLSNMFNLNLSKLEFVQEASPRQHLRAASALRGYDGSLTVTNRYPPGGVPRPHVSILQFPWGVATWSHARRWAAARAFRNCDRVVTYSEFVAKWVDSIPSGHSICVPPGVRSVPSANFEKECIILAVGRFSAGGHNKKHRALIDAFGQLAEELPGWRLVLVGAARAQDSTYIDVLRSAASGLDIEFRLNAPHADLEFLYQSAQFLWHATGYGEDAGRHPELMEHFGIVVVEAMSAGCVPIVFNGGGPPSIVERGCSGIVWSDLTELVQQTVRLAQNSKECIELSENAVLRSEDFGETKFAINFIDALPEQFG